MRVGIDARWIFPEITGIGSYTQELIRHIAEVDREHEYVLFFQHESVRERTLAFAGITEQNSRFSTQLVPYGPFSPVSQLVMRRILRRARLDLYHSTNFMFPLAAFPAQRIGRMICVVTIHDLIPLLFPEHTPKALKSRFHGVYKRVMKEVGRRADGIITVSESSRRDIIEHMAIPPNRADRVVAIHEAAAANYSPGATPQNDPRIILYVGRMDPYKNVVGLVDSFARLLRTGDVRARLRIIGPRDARYPQVEERIAAHQIESHIDWPGYVSGDELLAAYQQADVFVLPSYYEGFGLPVLEAMACGTPVICSNRASLPEVAGDAALIVDPDQPDALVAALRDVLTDRDTAQTLRVKGLHRAAQFSWQRTARETIACYERLHALR